MGHATSYASSTPVKFTHHVAIAVPSTLVNLRDLHAETPCAIVSRELSSGSPISAKSSVACVEEVQ